MIVPWGAAQVVSAFNYISLTTLRGKLRDIVSDEIRHGRVRHTKSV